MKKTFLTCICIIFGLLISQCEKIGQNPNPPGTTIRLTAISPAERVSHAPAFMLTANGVNFKTDSVILFNGIKQETTFISSAQLRCRIQPGQIIFSTLHVKSEDLPIKVRTPSANNHETDSLPFVLHDNHKFNTTVNIYDSTYDSRYPSAVIAGDGNIHVVWQDHVPGSHEIYYSSSLANGESWKAPRSLSGQGDFRAPNLAIDKEGNLFVVFYDNNNDARNIYIRRSTDIGTTWSTAQNLSHTLRGSFDPVITVGEPGRLYVAWIDDTPGQRTIVFTRSADYGDTWEQMRIISNMHGVANYAAICVDSMENVYLVWFQENENDFSLFFSHSMDKGDTWTTPLQLTPLATPLCRSDIAVDSGGIVHIVFDDIQSYSRKIYHMRSRDRGITWEPRQNISVSPGEDNWMPILVLDGADNLNVAWIGTAARGEMLYYSRSIDAGIRFGFADTNPGFQVDTDIAAVVDTKGDLHVVGGMYIQTENKIKLYYANSGTTR